MKTTLIFNPQYKKLRSATNIFGDFCYCTFGCTSKSAKSKVTSDSAGAVMKLRVVTVILYSTLQRCKIFGNVTVKNYLNESCCRFCASLFTVKVPSRKGFDVNCQECI